MTSPKIISDVLVWMIPVFAVVAFSGVIAFFQIADPYDFSRKAQIICLSLLIGFSAFQKKLNARTKSLGGILLYAVLTVALTVSLNAVRWSPFSIADASLYGMLFLGAYFLGDLLAGNTQRQDQTAVVLALAPLLNIWLMIVSTIYLCTTGIWNDWQLVFSTIREFDDALLPCLFILWHRPAGLALSRMTPLVWILSTLYALALWQDGARSVLLSALGALVFVAFLRRDRKLIYGPVSALAVAGALFYGTRWLFDTELATKTVFRLTTSQRSDLWGRLLDDWWRTPWSGIGGDHFGRHAGQVIAMHPHNIAMQWIGEYGVFGLGIVALAAIFVYQLLRSYRMIPPFCLGGLLACAINSLFSGAFIYPLSQLLIVWMAGWALACVGAHPPFSAATASNNPLNLRSRVMTILICALVLAGMWGVHGKDLFSRYSSNDSGSVSPPRFWQRGAVLHLEK